ncbi:MAG: hypothetical protein WA705_24910 [Candidatus Ozemobacteraceae bacterium]
MKNSVGRSLHFWAAFSAAVCGVVFAIGTSQLPAEAASPSPQTDKSSPAVHDSIIPLGSPSLTRSRSCSMPDPVALLRRIPTFPSIIPEITQKASSFHSIATEIAQEAENFEFIVETPDGDEFGGVMPDVLNMETTERNRLTRLQVLISELNNRDQEKIFRESSAIMNQTLETLGTGHCPPTEIARVLQVSGNAYNAYQEALRVRLETISEKTRSAAGNSKHPLILESVKQVRKQLMNDLKLLIMQADMVLSALEKVSQH